MLSNVYDRENPALNFFESHTRLCFLFLSIQLLYPQNSYWLVPIRKGSWFPHIARIFCTVAGQLSWKYPVRPTCARADFTASLMAIKTAMESRNGGSPIPWKYMKSFISIHTFISTGFVRTRQMCKPYQHPLHT